MYEIKILNNNDFNSVAKSDPRYAFVDDTNMGFADREKKVAYVRQTHIHDLNKYLVTHELEELESDDSTHEDVNGIRHKKFFKELLMPILGGIGGMFLGGPSGALSGYGLTKSIFSSGGSQESQSAPSGSYSSGSQSSYPSGSYTGYYSPLSSFNSGTGNYGSGNLPQTFSGTYSPTITSGGINTTNQSGNEVLDANLLEKLRGNYSGQMTF